MAAPLPAANVNQDFLPPAPVAPRPRPPSAMWNGFMVVVKFVYEVVAKVALFALMGLMFHFLVPAIAPPFFAIAIAALATRLVVKVLDLYDIACLDEFKGKVGPVMDKYKIELIAFAVAVAISPLSWIAACVIASAAGIMGGFFLGVEIAARNQERERQAQGQPRPNRTEFALL